MLHVPREGHLVLWTFFLQVPCLWQSLARVWVFLEEYCSMCLMSSYKPRVSGSLATEASGRISEGVCSFVAAISCCCSHMEI